MEFMSRRSSQNLTQIQFFQEIKGHFENVLLFEDQKLQTKVKRLIPHEELKIKVMERMRLIQREVKIKCMKSNCHNIETAEEDLSIEDLLLAQLLHWFKYEFFTWVDSPTCNFCFNECSFARVEPSRNSGISRIEIHRCRICRREVKFSRYTDPYILLSTRQGRCGEWANVFTLVCRSLGYDTRLVVDKTDHVWTEVWSVAQKRWIHADPCENVMDRPLMYEEGWRKELSYVIAYSKDEILDVTWRYTKNPEAVRKKRNLCPEINLVTFIMEINNQRLYSLTSNRRDYIVKRRLLELVDMLPAPPGCEKPEKDDHFKYEGRTSGSLAWRIARSETQVTQQINRKWLIPNGTQQYELRYYIVEDIYEVWIRNEKRLLETRNGWQEGLDKIEGGIFRKEELDWKMVYLARSPENEFGLLSWTFEVSDKSLFMSSLKLNALIGTFHGGNVKWEVTKFYLEARSEIEKIAINENENFEINLRRAVRVNLKAILCGGKDDLAWQHAQLFRQHLDSKECSFVISITLEEK